MNGEVSRQTAVGAGVCGVFLLICGAGCLISSFVLLGNDEKSGNGIWSGILLSIAGVLGAVTWWKRHKGVITGFLAVNIIVIITAFIQSIVAGIYYSDYNEGTTWRCYRDNLHSCKCYKYDFSYVPVFGSTMWHSLKYLSSFTSHIFSVMTAISSKDVYCNKSKLDSILGSLMAIVIFSIIGGFASFAGSIFGCMGACTMQIQPGTVVVQQPVVVTRTFPGYSVQQPAYSIQQPAYSIQQPGYSVQQPGYSVQQPGYSAQQDGHQGPQSGYQAPQFGYPAPQSGYQTPQSSETAQQASSSQVPNEPPPEYTKHSL